MFYDYDAAGRTLQGGLTLSRVAELATALEAAGLPAETRISQYDAAGQLVAQRTVTRTVDARTAYRYDAAGNLLHYEVSADESMGRYDYDYIKTAAGYQVNSITGNRGGGDGVTENTYDANGYLVRVTDRTDATHSRRLWNDTAGRVLLKEQDGNRSSTLIANDEVLGTTEIGAGYFHADLQPIGSTACNSTPVSYIVRVGDSLRGIAQAAWGDATLWYRIAEANGLAGEGALTPGELITLPARPTTVHNDLATFRPYSAADIVGDMSPANLPMPSQGRRASR